MQGKDWAHRPGQKRKECMPWLDNGINIVMSIHWLSTYEAQARADAQEARVLA